MTSDSPSGATGPRGLEVVLAHGSAGVDIAEIERLVQSVVASEGVTIDYLGVVLCGRDQHRKLHEQYLGLSTPTDVLAFDLEPESDNLDGEVYVDLDTASERHSEFNTTFLEEVQRYVVHGLLHLIGYSDRESTDATAMHARQEYLISAFHQRPQRPD